MLSVNTIEICTSELCHRPFQVNKYSNVSYSVLEPGRIVCPHCGALQDADSDSIFMTHALAVHEELDFMKRSFGLRAVR
jgi:hypothetical protein